MNTHCHYCLLTGHSTVTCPTLARIAKDRENHKLALQEAEEASMEELEVAAEIWDSQVEVHRTAYAHGKETE